MSHCTKFDFKYTSEMAIVKAFRKLDIKCSTELVSEFKSEFSKQVLGRLGYLGNKQYRAICGINGKYNIFLCKIGENDYELFVERSIIGNNDIVEMKKISEDFQRAYIEVAIDEIVKKLDKGNMPSKVESSKNKYIVSFGSSYEYSLVVSFEEGKITEEVIGVKGDFCTKLTEDIENILSHPSAELATEWKQEYNMQIEDQNIQVLSLNF
jgi:hypothetical protein